VFLLVRFFFFVRTTSGVSEVPCNLLSFSSFPLLSFPTKYRLLVYSFAESLLLFFMFWVGVDSYLIVFSKWWKETWSLISSSTRDHIFSAHTLFCRNPAAFLLTMRRPKRAMGLSDILRCSDFLRLGTMEQGSRCPILMLGAGFRGK